MHIKKTTTLLVPLLFSLLEASAAVRHVGAGNHHSIFLAADTNTVWTAGEDILGQLGKGEGGELLKNNPDPHQVQGGWQGKVVDVSAGLNTNAVLTENGELWTWGFNRLGQLGHSFDAEIVGTPKKVAGLPPIADVEAGSGYMLAITREGEVWAWGNNSLGQLGLGEGAAKRVREPAKVKLPAGIKVKDIATGINQVLALTTDGRVLGWGSNRNGQAGGGEGMNAVREPVFVEGLGNGPVAGIGVGNFTSYAITAAGAVFAWGENHFGQVPHLEDRSIYRPVVIDLPTNGALPIAISGGARYVHLVLENGRVIAWGVNGPQGQFGNNVRSRDVSQREAPTLLPEDVLLKEIHTQTNHTVGLTTDGKFVGWGSNAQGRLAQGPTESGDEMPASMAVATHITLESASQK